jgi:hypothetical protein
VTARLAAGALALVACSGSIELASDDDGTGGGPPDAGPPPADAAPLPADCREALTALGVDWSDAPAMPGVATPVTVRPPVGGLAYRYVANQTPRTSLFMDCQLALALARAADVLAPFGVVEVADIGVYNYRCIDQSVDPPCPGSSLSQHAFATAIDIAGLTTMDGTYYSVEDDWIIDPDGEATCAAATSGDKDAFLHAVLCAMHDAGVFNIYLTPNYNAAHRNHFHVDLTEGADFVGKPGAPGAPGEAIEREVAE